MVLQTNTMICREISDLIKCPLKLRLGGCDLRAYGTNPPSAFADI